MNWFRELNHWRIDSSKALLMKIIRFFFDKKTSFPRAENKNISNANPDFRNILILHFDDKIGDLVINSSIFRELKKKFIHASIHLVSGTNASPLVEYNPHINKIIRFKKGLWPTIKLWRSIIKTSYDLVIDLRLMTDAKTIFILNRIGITGTLRIGLNKKNYKVYDKTIEKDFKCIHACERVKALLEILGINNPDLKYDLHYSKKESELIQKLLPPKKPYIVLNVFAGARYRSFNENSIIRVINQIKQKFSDHEYQVVLSGPSQDAQFLTNCALKENDVKYFPEIQTLPQLCALISYSEFVISPDTSAVHIASAFNKKVIAFFRDDTSDLEKNSIQWAPTSPGSELILCRGKTDGYLDVNTFEDGDLKIALSKI